MDVTQVLLEEHRWIERALGVLDEIAARSHASGDLDTSAAADAVNFFRSFADRRHHAKEEDHLFPALEPHGLGATAGPVACMLSEHDRARAEIRAMGEAIAAVENGDDEALQDFLRSASRYAFLLRDHIAKEDGVLFPLAESVLTEPERIEVRAGYRRAEAEFGAEPTAETWVHKLERHLGLAPSS